MFRLIGLSKPHIMYMTGGDALRTDVESLSVVPAEEPDEGQLLGLIEVSENHTSSLVSIYPI